LTVVDDFTSNRSDNAGDRLKQGGFASAVRADDGNEFTMLDVERNAAQRAQAPVGDVKRPDF
jgi:hypothetical protein